MAHANISVNTMLPWLYLLVFVCLEVALFLLYTDSDIDTSQYLWVRIHSTSISAMAGVCWARLAASDEDRRDRGEAGLDVAVDLRRIGYQHR